MLKRAAPRLGTSISPEAAAAIAPWARGVAREALRLLERARDQAQVSGRPRIEQEHARKVAKQFAIDERGLWPDDRKILELLITHGRPMGIEAMAMTLRMDLNTLKLVHEPFLVGEGYVTRTSRGREATIKARSSYQLSPSCASSEPLRPARSCLR